MTVAQLRTCEQSHPDAPFQLDGQDLGQFIIIARVMSVSARMPDCSDAFRNVNKQATNIHYHVDDGTGSIDVRKWIDGGGDEDENDPNAIT